MMDSVLEKHKAEMDAVRVQYQSMVEGLNKQHNEALSAMRGAHTAEMQLTRESNAREIQVTRESNARELTAEREAGRRREERVEDQLKMEREERRRDQERQRELLEERDRQWKDRLEMQVQSTTQSWEARHQSVVTNYENRIQWQQQEIDRLKSEMTDMKVKITDNQDPIAIVHKAKEIRESLGVPEHSGPPSGGGSGGIGINSSEDWRNIAAEGLTERVPQILQALGGLLGGAGQQPQQPQQPQPQPGQVVQTPQGEMVVVQTPQGLALAPKAALAAAQQPQQQPNRQLPSQQRRRVMPDADEVLSHGGRKPRGRVSAVPNFAEMDEFGAPLPKRRPPWEGGGDEAPAKRPEAPTQQRPQQQQRPVRSSRPAQEEQPHPQRIARQMTSQERQALSVIAKLVHDSVMNADEPDEFAERMLKEWPPAMIKQITGTYSAEDIARGISETQPQSAGATPAGQDFVRAAFKRIEEESADE